MLCGTYGGGIRGALRLACVMFKSFTHVWNQYVIVIFSCVPLVRAAAVAAVLLSAAVLSRLLCCSDPIVLARRTPCCRLLSIIIIALPFLFKCGQWRR